MSKEERIEKEYVELALKTMMDMPKQVERKLIKEFLEDLNDAATFGRRSKLREKWEAKLDS